MGRWCHGQEDWSGFVMSSGLSDQWRNAFLQSVQNHERSGALRDAAIEERLGDWTTALTGVVAATCEAMGFLASAIGHPANILPVSQSEYLGMDVLAFPETDTRWRFPVVAVELENSRDEDRIAYSLWKVLCVRVKLRVVYCYRRGAEEGPDLVEFLQDGVIRSMELSDRTKLEGETLVVVGSRDDAATFPYGFFKWWNLDTNTATFRLI